VSIELAVKIWRPSVRPDESDFMRLAANLAAKFVRSNTTKNLLRKIR
jgi:hypothetical protein